MEQEKPREIITRFKIEQSLCFQINSEQRMNFSDRQKISIIVSSLLFSFFPFSFQSLVRAEMYKWVDEKGVIHFSDTPPSDREADLLPETPVNKIGGGKPAHHTRPSISGSERKEAEKNRLRRITREYEREIDKLTENIKQYRTKIADLEDRKRFMVGYSKTYGSRSYYVIEDYDGMIREYEKKIEDAKRNIVHYQQKIFDMRNALQNLILSD